MATSSFQSYPEITRLSAALEKHQIRIEVQPETTFEKEYSWRTLLIKAAHKEYILSIYDEYSDAEEKPSQPMLLHLALWSCSLYDEAEDFLEWCVDAAFSASSAEALQLYRDLGTVVPHFLELIGDDAAPLSDWDFNMNTGVTQHLRSLYQPGQ